MITRDAALLECGLTPGILSGAVREFFGAQSPRRERLKRYYDGEHAISGRARAKGAANNRIAADYPRYIVTMASGYMAGSPIGYQDEAQERQLSALLAAYDRVNIEAVDAEITVNQSLYGVGLEALFMDEAARPTSAAVDPRYGFVVYDDTVRHAPLFGVMWRARHGADGAREGYAADAYTSWEVIGYAGQTLESLAETGRAAHPFGAVPLIEYWNNADERGDFEPVMGLIDAYDTLQSDRVNDKEQFADSLLVFTGVGGLDWGDPQDKRGVGERLRMEKAVALPDKDARVEWLTNSLNETDTQVLADSIRADIHKMSLVPDLTDQNFSGNTSGVAMRYKLLGLEQLTKIKERWFREGLRQRLRQYAAALGALGGAALDAERVRISFTRSLPVNDLEIAQTVRTLQGIVPDALLLAQVPFIQDARAALETLRAQREEAARQQSALFNQYADANGPNRFDGQTDGKTDIEAG
ncbi:MAG: phage portal protein [Oscillospiraceae bacterium]|jgi:SPP1 family phage portal protein|nr:phage portal protein [Oscillospiraceae bacterium]